MSPKLKTGLLAGGILLCAAATAFAQAINSAQGMQPFRWVALLRLTAAVNEPDFRTFSDGEIAPTIGTAGTYTRSGTIHYWKDLDTVASVTANNPEVNAKAAHRLSPSSNKEGVLFHGINRNEAQHTNAFNSWTAIGTVTVTTNATTAPDGTTTAERLQCDNGEGLQLALVQNSTDFDGAYMTIGLGIKAVSGTPTIRLRVKDEGGNYPTVESHTGFTVTNAWRYYEGWTNTPTPGDGALVYEITCVGAADVYLSFANLQFTGQIGDWDHHSLGHIPSYKATAGASRESTGATTLSYAGSEITGSISEYTVNQWAYFPDVDMQRYGYDYFLFGTEDDSDTSYASLQHDQTNKLKARFGSNTAVSSSAHNLRRMVRGRWAMVTYATKSGDSSIYLDGVEIFTNSGTYSPFSVAEFLPGAGGGTVQRFGWPLGRTEIWKQRLTDVQVAQLYSAQADNDDTDAASAWYFPTTGATDVIRFNAIDGNITSSVQGITVSEVGAVEYQTQGVAGIGNGSGLKGVHLDANGYFSIATLPAAYNIADDQDFVVMAQVYLPLTNGSGEAMLFDCSDYGSANNGFMALISSTNVDFYVYSGGSGHVSRWAHGGKIEGDGKFYTLRWVFNHLNDTALLYYKAAGENEVGPITTTQALGAFSSLGAITIGGENMRFGVRSNSTNSELVGSEFQFALANGTLTYDAVTKP